MQHREWNPKTFFKKVSPEVMALFEEKHGLALTRDPEQPKHEQTYRAWTALPEVRRQKIEVELLVVNDLCSSHARPYLEKLARVLFEESVLAKTGDWSVYDLAMRLFIESPQDVIRCHQQYAVDMMDHFKEYRGKHPADVKASAHAKEEMKKRMAEHFRQHAGGARCQVEDFESADKFALFIYHEGEVTPYDRFDEKGVVVPIWQRPVVRIAAVYYPESCTLLVKAPRLPERERLRDLFAEIFVGEPDYFEDLSCSPKSNFAPLEDEQFSFPTDPRDGVEEVSVTRVTMRPPHASLKRLSVDLVPGLTMLGVHEALLAHGTVLPGATVDGVRLQFKFAEGTGRARLRTVSLFNPGSTNLRDTGRDRIIRHYLKEWGIDDSANALAMAAPPLQAAASA